MAPEEEQQDPGRVGFRDIYRAVGESEQRIVAALTAAIAPLTASAADHEQRLRQIESNGSPDARDALERVKVLEGIVTPHIARAAEETLRLGRVEQLAADNRDAIKTSIERRQGIFTTLSTQKTIILVLGTIAGVLIGLAQFLYAIKEAGVPA